MTNSAFVKDYYLANRPLVRGANVLPIDCTNAETITPLTFTNQILTPFLGWLATNPTKHPQYIILFPEIPSAVCVGLDCANGGSSVSYGLSTSMSGIQPFITSINMGLFDTTNDCVHYIDKLKSFGTNNQVLISASAGVYGNTNYYFDDTRNLDVASYPNAGGAARSGVLAANPMASVTYSNVVPDPGGLQGHITTGSNVAGYLSWSAHSALGSSYATNGYVTWSGSSGWWIIETIESFNGLREYGGQAFFLQWFSLGAFGGTNNYSKTPVGAVSHVYEPGGNWNDPATYFGLWEARKNFGICSWNSRKTPYFQAVGDPLVTK